MRPLWPLSLVLLSALPAAAQPPVPKGVTSPTIWPMYGGTPGRNMVNPTDRDILRVTLADKGLPFLWKAELGSRSYAQSVVAGGRVFVGTNNERPRNKRDQAFNKFSNELEPIDKGVLMCFDAGSGKFLWQAVFDKLPAGQVMDWPKEGLVSIPTVEDDRVYFVTNRCTVVCADVKGFADGNQGFQNEKYRDATDADILWEYDMIREQNVFPHNMSSGCPLIVGDVLITITSNGVDEGHLNIPSPDAPSVIALDKRSGKLLWKDASPGKAIMHGQWSPPSFAADPVPQVIVGQGDGWLRAFDPATGRLLWKFDCNRKHAVYELGGTGEKSDFIAAPVVHEGRVYIGIGQDPEHTTGFGRLWCIDLKRAVENGAKRPDRDASPDLLLRESRWLGSRLMLTVPNRESAEVWHFGGEDHRPFALRDFTFGRTLSTVCIVDGIVYAAELAGYLHCFDARTGKRFWYFDTKASIWGAPYFVDGKILMGNDNGDLFVFRHDPRPDTIDEDDVGPVATLKEARLNRLAKRREVAQKYLMQRIEFDAPIRGTPTVASGVLYIVSEKTLYAIGRG